MRYALYARLEERHISRAAIRSGLNQPAMSRALERLRATFQGECVVTFRGKKVTVRAGETANVPANAPHFIRNESDQPAHVLCTCAPAGQDRFFLAVGIPVPSRDSKPPLLDDAAKAAIGAKAKALAAEFATEFM
jgi:Cupin domain